MPRAGGGRNAPSQHEVVGRVLALAAEPGTDRPRQRVEPPDTTQRFGRHLQHPVAAAHVRELVQQHDVHPLRRPLGRRHRQHDDRPAPAPRRHQTRTRTQEQVDAASQAARPREVDTQSMPRPILHPARRRAEPSEPRQPDQEHTGTGGRAHEPDGHGQPADDVVARDGRHRRLRERDVGAQSERVGHERFDRSHPHRRNRQEVERGRRDRRHNADRQHPPPRGSRALAQTEGADQRQEQDRRHLDGQHGQQAHHGSPRLPLAPLPTGALPRDAPAD